MASHAEIRRPGVKNEAQGTEREAKMLRPGITYNNVSIGGIAALLERLSIVPRAVDELSAEDREIAIFAKDADLMTEKSDKYSLTRAGEGFLKANQNDRRATFRSMLFQIEQFARVWTEIVIRGHAKGDLVTTKEIRNIIRHSSQSELRKGTLGVYSSRVTNWAADAGMLEREPGKGRGHYRIVDRSQPPEGQTTTIQLDEGVTIEKVSIPRDFIDYLREINLAVYDLVKNPEDKRLVDEVLEYAKTWKSDTRESGVTETEKKIILNEIDSAFEESGLRRIQILAENLTTVRRKNR